jgi:hypothetical protein
MVAFVARERTFPRPNALVRFLRRKAKLLADMIAGALEATGFFRHEPPQLPAGFLLEFAAVLQLGLWERQGLQEYLPAALPSYREATRNFSRRASKGPAEFEGPSPAPLSQQVLGVFIQHFASGGPKFFQTDPLVGDVDEEEFADVLAEFLWTHRSELTRFFQTTDSCGESQPEGPRPVLPTR